MAALVWYGVWVTFVQPISVRLFYDPAIQYMESSLSVFRGAEYHYVDHPGTPVEVLGTLLLALSYPIVAGTPDGFVGHYLRYPQDFMSIAQTMIALASIGTYLFVCARALSVAHWTHAVAGAGVAGLFFGLHPAAFATLAIWSHTSFCYFGGTLLSFLVLLAVRPPRPPTWRHVIALGFACGVLTSVQLYFVAWVAGAAVAFTVAARVRGLKLMRALRRGEVTLGMSAVGFIVSTLPIHDQYLDLLGWVQALSNHQGIYGAGPPGFSTPELLVANTWSLSQQQPILLGATYLSVALTIFQLFRFGTRRQPSPALMASGAGLTIQLLVLLVLVAKHPAVRYLLPVAATVPVLIAALLGSLNPSALRTRWLALSVGVVSFALFGWSFWTAVDTHIGQNATLQRDDAAMALLRSRFIAASGNSGDSLRTLWTYGTTSECYARWFGDMSAEFTFEQDIASLCLHDSNLDVWTAKIWSADAPPTPVATFVDWDIAVFPAELLSAYPASRPGGSADEVETSLSPIDRSLYGTLVVLQHRD